MGRQQVGSCGDFVNLYLGPSGEDAQAHLKPQLNVFSNQTNEASFPFCFPLGVKEVNREFNSWSCKAEVNLAG